METTFVNASAVGYNTVSNGLNGIGTQNFGIVIIVTLIIGFALAVLSYAAFSRFAKYLDIASKTVQEAIIGALALGTLYAIWYVLQQAGEALESVPPIYYAYAIVGFLACVFAGKIVIKSLEKLSENYEKLQAEKAKTEVKQ